MSKELKKISVNGKDIVFVNESKGSRYGFSHTSTLFIDGVFVNKGVCHYLNRTWESYRYQSAMKCCIDNEFDSLCKRLKAEYKSRKGYSNMSAKRNAEFEQELSWNSYVNLLKEIRDNL